jgi:hypothetical protein
MAWEGLEYLKVPQWRTAFERADVIFGVGRPMAVSNVAVDESCPPALGFFPQCHHHTNPIPAS